MDVNEPKGRRGKMPTLNGRPRSCRREYAGLLRVQAWLAIREPNKEVYYISSRSRRPTIRNSDAADAVVSSADIRSSDTAYRNLCSAMAPAIPDSPRASQSPPPLGPQGDLEMELMGLANALYNLGTTVINDSTKDRDKIGGVKQVGMRVYRSLPIMRELYVLTIYVTATMWSATWALSTTWRKISVP
jgi:hypothetical protein